jgi:acylglycerol lipase
MSRVFKVIGLTALGLALAAGVLVAVGARPSVGECTGPSGAASAGARFSVAARDGNCLMARAFAPPAAARGVVVLVHGLHDHPGRYADLVRALNEQGLAAVTFDHRGHGASGGAHQRMDSLALLADDVERVLQQAATRHPGVPVFLYGHSLGGLVVAQVAADHATNPAAGTPLAGVVLSSAALALPATASGPAVAVVSTLAALAPSLGLEAIDAAQVVRTPQAQAELKADPAIERGKVPARTVATLLQGIQALQPRLASIQLPLLVLHGGADAVTPVAGSRALVAQARSSDKTLVVFEAARHSLLQEPEGPQVQQAIVGFVDRRAGATPKP